MDELFKKYYDGTDSAAPALPAVQSPAAINSPIKDSLFSKYYNDTPANPVAPAAPLAAAKGGVAEAAPDKSIVGSFNAGVGRGVSNTLDTVASGIGAIDAGVDRLFKSTIGRGTGGTERNAAFGARAAAGQETFDKNYGDSTSAYLGKLTGEIAATAPLISTKVIQGMRAGLGALPTIAATGERVAAPLVNRLGAAAATNAYAGATFNAATLAGRKDNAGLPWALGEGAALGAVTGPLLHSVASAGANIGPTIKRLWANTNINQIATDAGLAPVAVRNAIEVLQNAGLTPQQAQAELTALGPKATLLDLAESITSEGSGLASKGGVPTSILKGRMGARQEIANNSALQIMEQKLGPKPDIEVEREAIKDAARNLAGPNYEIAHASKDKVDVSDVVSSIDEVMKDAVGPQKSLLKKVKGYFFRDATEDGFNSTGYAGSRQAAIDKLSADTKPSQTIKDAIEALKNGSTDIGEKGVIRLKDDVKSLHIVREGIDDLLTKMEKKGESGTHTFRNLSKIRSGVDEQLKLNDPMKAADEVFAAHMKVKEGLDIGYNALKTGRDGYTREEFTKLFDAANPDIQEAIRKGLRASIGDSLEKAQRGELAGAQALFGKKSINRAKIEKVFGSSGTEVLDELSKEGAFRATENAIRSGSQTAERNAIQEKYDLKGKSGIFGDSALGAALDLTTGSSGVGTAMMAGRRKLADIGTNIHAAKVDRLVEGTADLLSRSGAERDMGMSVLSRVKAVQDRLPTSGYRSINELPTILGRPLALPAIAGEEWLKPGVEKAIRYWSTTK